MTDPTPTPQTPPQWLTDEQLLELAAGKIEFYDRIEPGEYEAENECALEVYGSELIAVMRAAIAAHEAARAQLPPTPNPTTTPPQLTDKQLLELADGEIEADDVLPMDEYEAANDRALEVYRSELLAFGREAIAAHEAARAQLPPGYIDDGHTDEDRKLLEAFYVACRAEGGTADEIVLRGIRAAVAADRAARPTPTPEALQAAYVAWFKAEQGIPPSPAAARTAAAFALHLLRVEVAA